MRFLFKTDYDQDMRLFKHGGQVFWYGLLAALLIAAPFLVSEYVLSQLHFICIYSIVGLGLMLLVGYTGQISLGHAAFLAVGAYTEALLQAKGVPFVVSLTSAGAAVGGGRRSSSGCRRCGSRASTSPSPRSPSTSSWRRSSRAGSRSPAATRASTSRRSSCSASSSSSDASFYYLCLALTALSCLALMNLLRSPTGRAFVAIRDSEISASCMGINLAKYKTMSFALSAALTGIAGALYAHKVAFITPEQFTLLTSIELVTIVIIGGVGSLHGAVLGAAFIIVLPQLISIGKDWLPSAIANQSGLQSIVFGLVLIVFIVFEPLGLYGRWLKIRSYFQLFPFYRAGTFRRQKSYMQSERLR